MTAPISNAESRRLLEHSGWVRDLARKLVRDPHLADDLAQETWLAAFEHRPRSEGNLRAWLGTVLRNLVRQVARGDGRREQRERSSARPEATDSTLDAVGRLSLHRRVVEVVMGLAEPYRTVILLRYFEGHTPAEIARRLETPVSTVKTQLARGIDLLRSRLERERSSGGGSMLMALVPLTWKSGGPTAPVLGVFIVSAQVKIVLACVVALAGAFAFWPDGDRTPLGQTTAAPSQVVLEEDIATASDAEVNELATGTHRLEANAPSESVPIPAAVASGQSLGTPVNGRTMDVEGRPLSGEPVAFVAYGEGTDRLSGTEPNAVSDPSGRFSIAGAPPERGLIVATGADRTTVYTGATRGDRKGAESVVVVAPRHPLGGQVVDGLGQPLAGARVALVLPDRIRGQLANVMDHSEEVFFSDESDESGRFDLAQAPFVDGALITAYREGYGVFKAPVPSWPDTAMSITLTRPTVVEGMLSGQVVDAQGVPVPDAHVSFGLESTRSDENGLFGFDLDSEESMNVVSAHVRGGVRETLVGSETRFPARSTRPRI